MSTVEEHEADMREYHDQLRSWARGTDTIEAATELLIRTGWALPGYLWMKRDDNGGVWIDFTAIPHAIGGYSGGEQRVLRIAASLGAEEPVILSSEITGIDRDQMRLVLAAITHAAGYAVTGRTIETNADGHPQIVPTEPLNTWPA